MTDERYWCSMCGKYTSATEHYVHKFISLLMIAPLAAFGGVGYRVTVNEYYRQPVR